ncbi:hypothetical protein ACKWTF_012589 [Chironomus riparius]
MKIPAEKTNICAKKKSRSSIVKCKFCDKTMIDKIMLYHMRKCHPNEFKNSPFYCGICNQRFLSSVSLRSHNGLKHPKSKSIQPETHECDFDGKVFRTKNKLWQHMKIHLSKIECKICGKLIKIVSLDGHMKQTHATENKFQCKICPKSFKSNELLHIHERIHDKKFQCGICKIKFAANSRLHMHIKRDHENPGSYQCES